MKTKLITGISLTALMLVACASQNRLSSSSDVYTPSGPGGNDAPYVAPMQGDAGNFDSWKNSLRARAMASGISAATYASAEPYLVYKPSVVSSDRSQSEFVKPIWDYVEGAVSSRRSQGRSKAAEWGSTLSAIESKYGVDRDVIMGIWGMETNFGGFMGNTNVFSAMSTLAYEGRRRDWAEQQIIYAMKIVQDGDRTPSGLIGSWGGAMGHTQFIPEMYHVYAVDYSGDGQRDIWYPTDALASTANYLRGEGWISGQPWGVEVKLPADFNYIEADTSNFKSPSYWRNNGVTSLSPRGLPSTDLAIYLPAGHRGPAFAITKNFAVIKRYNPSDSYALAVGLVGDTAFGLPGVQASWPRDETPLRRSQIKSVQTRLMSMGYDTGGADGVAGRNTRASVRDYQASIGMLPDGFLNQTVYNRLMSN